MEYQLSYHDANYKRQYINDTFYNTIIKSVSTKLKRPLERAEQHQVISFIKKMDPALLSPAYKGKTIPVMVDTLYKEFFNAKCCQPLYDNSQQILRDTIGISSESGTAHSIYDNPAFMLNSASESKQEKQLLEKLIPKPGTTQSAAASNKDLEKKSGIINLLGMTTADEAVRILNPESQYKKNHILLDSRYRIFTEQSSVDINKFSWNYVQKSQSTIDGSVNIIGNTRDIVALRIFPFRIPYTKSADNKYQRISVFIEELGSQSFIGHEQRKFHFMLNSVVDTEFIDVGTDLDDQSYFWFEKPITTLDTLTISFGNPLEPIVFERDRDFCGIDYFSITPLTQITTEKNHNLSNGDRVYFTNFNVGAVNPLLIDQVIINENIKNTINSISGHLVTVINSTQFSIPVDTSNIQNPIANIRFKVFYGSKRLFLPFEIIYIMPELGSTSN
jgi:hypothetical protein